MTGTGTQANPYVPENWAELKTAAEQAGVYIRLLPNTEWDMNDQYPEDTPGITLNCKEINGNGATIKNLRKSSGNLFNLGNYSTNDCLIYNLSFNSLYFTSATMFYAIGSYSSARINLLGVSVGGEFYDSHVAQRDTQKLEGNHCAFSLYLSNSGLFGRYGATFTNTSINANGTVNGDTQVTLISSAFYGSLRSLGGQYAFNFSGEACVVDCAFQNFYQVSYYGDATTVVLNIDKTGEAIVYGNCIRATTAQMMNAEWLNAAGFPCRVG